MLKLTSSFSKKVPAETQFSSQSYHAAVEVELPDGLTEAQLKERIHNTFELVRNSVETEIGSKTNGTAKPVAVQPAPQVPQQQQEQKSEPASNKQVLYFLALARESGIKPDAMLKKFNATSAYDLNKQQCSSLINELNPFKKAA